jgi:hypothetical protein
MLRRFRGGDGDPSACGNTSNHLKSTGSALYVQVDSRGESYSSRGARHGVAVAVYLRVDGIGLGCCSADHEAEVLNQVFAKDQDRTDRPE